MFFTDIPIDAIDPSPFQQRRNFDDDDLNELARNIQIDGLIHPIVVRQKGDRCQLIVGERRWRAFRDFTDMRTIPAIVVCADDYQSRRMVVAEKILRQDLCALDEIAAIVDLVDAQLGADSEYRSQAETPLERVSCLLGKLHSICNSEYRGSVVSTAARKLLSKFIQPVQNIFENLPKPLQWRSFYRNDLPLLTDFCTDVHELSIQHRLTKSQTRALVKLKENADDVFRKIAGQDQLQTNTRSPNGTWGHTERAG